MHTEVMQTLRWLRVPGDTLFALGAIALVWFVAGLKTGHSLKRGPGNGSPQGEPKPLS
jgi:nitric oxide reductase subunit B